MRRNNSKSTTNDAQSFERWVSGEEEEDEKSVGEVFQTTSEEL